MKYLADLHTHSAVSDGQCAPAELIRLAKECGLQLVALTDHDTVEGVGEAAAAGRELGIQVLQGVELSAREHTNFHILGYGYDPAALPLRRLCARQQTNRLRRVEMILDFLRKKGFVLSVDEVEQLAGSSVIGRPHFAQALVTRGYVKSSREAFDRLLDTAEFWERIPRLEADAETCIQTIKASGGKASLAHPYQMRLPDRELEALVAQLAAWGLDALECHYPKYTREQQALYLYLAKKYGLHITGGSDFHGEEVKPDVQLAALELELDWLVGREVNH